MIRSRRIAIKSDQKIKINKVLINMDDVKSIVLDCNGKVVEVIKVKYITAVNPKSRDYGMNYRVIRERKNDYVIWFNDRRTAVSKTLFNEVPE